MGCQRLNPSWLCARQMLNLLYYHSSPVLFLETQKVIHVIYMYYALILQPSVYMYVHIYVFHVFVYMYAYTVH